jgi:hypothetical protein
MFTLVLLDGFLDGFSKFRLIVLLIITCISTCIFIEKSVLNHNSFLGLHQCIFQISLNATYIVEQLGIIVILPHPLAT